MEKKTILIVDDDSINHDILSEMLESSYSLIHAYNGKEAIEKFKTYEKELLLVLLDMMMPDKNGLEVIEELKKDKPLEIPIILVTALETSDVEIQSIKAGAVDYIRKPFNTDVIKARIAAHIALKKNTDYLKKEIETAVKERTKIIESIVVGLANMVEYRSIESGEHVKRVQDVTRLLIGRLCETTDIFKSYTIEELNHIIYASTLHDIGKVGIEDAILNKPGKFTDEEFEKMKEHTQIGAKMADNFYMGENGEFVKTCKDVILCHHEKWDGSGYPAGLKAEEIPISARIVTVADSFDAMLSPRVYKQGRKITEVFETLKQDSGTHFDPQIVEVMLKLEPELRRIYKEEEN